MHKNEVLISFLFRPLQVSVSRQQVIGSQVKDRNRLAIQRQKKELEVEVIGLKRQLWAEKKKMWRAKKNIPIENLSPNSQAKRLTKGLKVPQTLFNNLKEGCAVKSQLRQSFKSITNRREKAIVSKYVAGKLLKSARMLKSVSYSLAAKFKRSRKSAAANKGLKSFGTKQLVTKFLESKRASIVCPGKRQGKKYDGIQRQKRYMTADLRALHKEFLSTLDTYISYRTFCRYKPKWVVSPKLTSRDTCLCVKCENMKLLAKSLKNQGLVDDNLRDLTNSVCCDPPIDNCLLRTCEKCKDKTLNFEEYDGRRPALFYKWISCREKVYSFKLKKEIEVNVLKKSSEYVTVEELKQVFLRDHAPYMMHIGRHLHQTQAFDALVETLDQTEMLFLMDWSMNYVCKYGREPQSVHFGASHKQLGFHTGRLYTAGNSQSILTISEITRHDPAAIIAHIIPVLTKYLEKHKEVTNLYFASDGPVTQYRNRDMYFLLVHHVKKLFPQITKIEWSFSEAGHGKGEADAVGGLSKRACDTAVAQMKDVDTIEKVHEIITNRCPSIDVSVINLESILAVDRISVPKTVTVEGTMKMHHYTWKNRTPNEIMFKTLSCKDCPREKGCDHFSLGKPWYLDPPKKAPKPAAPANKKAKGKRKAAQESGPKPKRQRKK